MDVYTKVRVFLSIKDRIIKGNLNMIKTGLKSYLKNLKYIFISLGLIFLFLIIGLTVSVKISTSAVKTMVNTVAKALSSASLSFDNFIKEIGNAFNALDWSDTEATLKTITGGNWLATTFKTALEALLGSELPASLSGAVEQCIGTIMFSLMLAGVITLIGAIIGYWMTIVIIRQEEVKSKMHRRILYGLFDTFVAIVIIVSLYLFSRLGIWALIIAIILLLLIMPFKDLLLSYLEFGRGKIAFKEIAKPSTFFLNVLSMLIITVANASVCLLIFFLINKIVGVLLMVASLIVLFAVSSANLKAFIKKKADEVKVEAAPDEETLSKAE